MFFAKKRLINFSRWLFSLCLIASLFYLRQGELKPSDPIHIYSSICQDNLLKVVLKAIEESKSSIHLSIYSLTDEILISALNKKAKDGISITVIHDPSTPREGIEKLSNIKCIPYKTRGLMHQKILIIDRKKIFIGSANFTTESLRLHDNLIIQFISQELSDLILSEEVKVCPINGQEVEFWPLPKKSKEGAKKVISMIENAQRSLKVAMYTWTHPQITESIIAAKKRGIKVEVILDRNQALGAGKKITQQLIKNGINIWIGPSHKMMHHKFMIIDDQTFVSGSANWTQAAFSRNEECFVIIYEITLHQKQKLLQLWKYTRILSTEQHTIG